MILMMNDSNGNQDNKQITVAVSCPSAMSDDDDDNFPSSPGSSYAKGFDLMAAAMKDQVTAQLAAAGPVGVAAAAAIVSSKRVNRPHSFETNPVIRNRQQNRLLRKLKQTIDEFTIRVGQQAIVLVATPGNPISNYKVFGAKPLKDVIINMRGTIMQELENALSHQAPPPIKEDPTLFELPLIIIGGIPIPVEKMTQAQLRAFIPLMLKFSTGRGKPGWGRQSTKPPWWPKEVPWANVRLDARREDEKQNLSWTHALRQIVINCYKFHGREDLLPAYSEEDKEANAAATANANISTAISTQYTPTILHTIINPDSTVRIVQVDPDNPIITLPDGTMVNIQELAALQSGNPDGIQIDIMQNISEGETTGVVDLNSVTEANLNSEG